MNHFGFLLLLLSIQSIAIAQKKYVETTNWKIAASLPAENKKIALGVAGAVSGIHNDVLIVAGGANFPDKMPWHGGPKMYHNKVHLFRKDEQSNLSFFKSLTLPFSIGYAGCTSTPQGVISVGGENEDGLTDQVFLLQWNEETDSINVKNLPSLPFKLANAAVVHYNGLIYVFGGEKPDVASSDCFKLNLQSDIPKWEYFSSLPKPISHSVAVVSEQNGDVHIYIVGGRKKNNNAVTSFYSSVYRYNINKGTWKEQQPLPYAFAAGTGISANNGSITLFGGDTGEVFHKTENLILAIKTEADIEKKSQLELSKIQVQSTHPGFCRDILSYSPKKNKWKRTGCMPFATPVTTTAIRWNDEVIIPSGEIKAGVRTPHILSAKLIKDN